MSELTSYFEDERLPLHRPAGTHQAGDKIGDSPRRIRLIAIDLDGTLLRTDKRLSQASVDAVKQCLDRDVKVVLASARPPRSCREIHEKLGLDTCSIHYNGALIHDFARSRNIYHQPMEVALARRVINAARRLDPACLVSIEILDKWYTDNFDPDLATETSKSFYPDFVGPLDAFLKVPITKLMLLGPPPRLRKVWQMVQKRFRGKVGMAVSDDHLIQLMHHQVDKGTALAQVAAGLGIDASEVMAIGDAPNDHGMLKWAGLGVAMGNAWDSVRKAADVIVPANDDDGVAHALQQFVLRQPA